VFTSLVSARVRAEDARRDELHRHKQTQKTRQGADTPIPKRGDFFRDLKEAATPEKKSERSGPKK
jgi:hypothetical protein